MQQDPTLSNLEQQLAALRLAELQIQCKVHSTKSSFESYLIYRLATTGCNDVYKYLKHLPNQHHLPVTIYLDSTTASSDHGKARLFKQYFYSVFIQGT